MKFFHPLVQQLVPVCASPAEAASQAWLLLEKVTGLSRTWFLAHADYALTPDQQLQMDALVNRRVHERVPVQYLLGCVPFLDLTLTVRPPTLIPRPETEEWVAWLIDTLAPVKEQPLRILDVCTGSGCIALALAHALPRATVLGTDISEEAIVLATENARNNGLANVSFMVSDLLDGVQGKQFDLVVGNPPYITQAELVNLEPEVREWEDERALLGGDDGLILYRRLIKSLRGHLDVKGLIVESDLPVVVLELGTDAMGVNQMLLDAGIAKTEIRYDMQGFARWVTGVGLTGAVD